MKKFNRSREISNLHRRCKTLEAKIENLKTEKAKKKYRCELEDLAIRISALERTEFMDYLEKIGGEKLKSFFDISEPNGGSEFEISKYLNKFYSYWGEDVDWNYYSKSSKYPKVWHTSKINIGYNLFVGVPKKLLIIDGMPTIDIKLRYNKNGIKMYKAAWLQKTHAGKHINKVDGYIAFCGKFSFHSQKIKEARVGAILKAEIAMEKKIEKKLKIREEKKIFDTFADVKITREISYAAGNCESGTENFIEENGISGDYILFRDLVKFKSNVDVRRVIDYSI